VPVSGDATWRRHSSAPFPVGCVSCTETPTNGGASERPVFGHCPCSAASVNWNGSVEFRPQQVRPDRELLSLEVWAEKKTCSDHGQAFSVGRGVVLICQDEAPAVVADQEDALVWLLL